MPFATSSNLLQLLFSIETLFDIVDFPHYFAVAEDPGFPSAILETVRSDAGATLDACTTGAWQIYMAYDDSAGELTLAYPFYLVSGTSAPFAYQPVISGSWDNP